MAIATGTAIAIAAGTALAAGGAQAVSGAVRAKRAKRDLENFERQEVTDLANEMRVSDLGEQRNVENIMQSEANQTEAIQMGGSRAVIGATSGVQANTANALAGSAVRTDEKLANLQNVKYQDKVRQFNTVEARQNQTIAGMANEMQAGRQAVQQGFQTMAGVPMKALESASNVQGALT
tara:strand:+ start:1746 stop:2282 length:537 start_codon:yes stop_codon:yes gene_type:complete